MAAPFILVLQWSAALGGSQQPLNPPVRYRSQQRGSHPNGCLRRRDGIEPEESALTGRSRLSFPCCCHADPP